MGEIWFRGYCGYLSEYAIMGYNFEKQRHECDRCGKPIPSNQVVQLCKECDEWLEAQYKDKTDVIGYKLVDDVR